MQPGPPYPPLGSQTHLTSHPPLGATGTGPNAAGGGRITKGFRLLGRSAALLRQRPVLAAFPALSAVAVTIATLAIFVPVLYLDREALPDKLAITVAGAAVAFPFTFLTTFCNVGFIAMVRAHAAGEEPSVRNGLGVARTHLRVILLWSLLSTLVGGALRLIEEIPGVGTFVGKVLTLLGGLAWSLATYFVVPVMVTEGVGVRTGIARSASVFRRRWGETLTGGITVGAAIGILAVPGCFVVCAGLVALEFGATAVGLGLIVVAVLWTAPLLAYGSALTEMFQLVLYQEAVTGRMPRGFTDADLGDALHRRRRLRDL